MKTSKIRNSKTNKVNFYRDGKRVFDFTISGNIVEFSNGDIILL
jgi:NMD protein affecting ribosome stability and mRNA decay